MIFIGSHYLIITCPRCSHQGQWYLITEKAMCDNCAHSFSIIEGENE